MERRKSERVRCRFLCRIECGGETFDGLVLDMSEGGLSVRSAQKASQGDAVRLTLQAPRGPLEVEALVWHSRMVKQRGSREPAWLLGVMISKARAAYYDMLPCANPQAGADAASAEPIVEPVAPLPSFRIRVKQRGAPRTRVLSLNAQCEEEVRSLAAADLGEEWEILGIEPA